VLSLGLAACGGDNQAAAEGEGGVSGEVVVDGSSTVQPLTAAAGELFGEEQPGVNVSVATSGTGGGFEKFCQDQTDISDASRPIAEDEAQMCEQNGVEYTELIVANDGLSLVVSKENDFAECLTVEQLQKMWAPESEGKVDNWNQIDPSFPDAPLELYGPGTDSGTFDYFTEAVNGEEGASRSDYNASEDDNVIVQGVSGSPNAVGYFGYSYLEENSDALKPVSVDGGDGCVEPSPETVGEGSYQPLGRPIFIYVKNSAYADKSHVSAFVDYYIENVDSIAETAGFIALNDEQKSTNEEALSKLG